MDSGVIKFITLEENGHAIIDRTISEELLFGSNRNSNKRLN